MTQLKLVKTDAMFYDYMADDIMKAQAEFHNKFGIDVNKKVATVYLDLIDEEHEEWVEEFYSNPYYASRELKELTDLLYTVCGLAHQLGYTFEKSTFYTSGIYLEVITEYVEKLLEQDTSETTLNSLILAIYGYAHSRQWDLTEAYWRVHESNLSKLGDDGVPVRREDGKIMKGPNYYEPELEDLVDA